MTFLLNVSLLVLCVRYMLYYFQRSSLCEEHKFILWEFGLTFTFFEHSLHLSFKSINRFARGIIWDQRDVHL